MPTLLEALAGRERRPARALTGNLEPIARLKLRAPGLGDYFARGQGAFGSDSEDRAALPAIARARAGAAARPTRAPHRRDRRHPARHRLRARRRRARVAVATGPYGADELSAADAVAATPRTSAACSGDALSHAQ